MEKQPQEKKEEEQESLSTVARRRALQALVAAGGAAVFVNLPKKWIKPIVEVMQMPAHAEGASIRISNLKGWSEDIGNSPVKVKAAIESSSAQPEGTNFDCPPTDISVAECSGSGEGVAAQLDFFDPLKQVNQDVIVKGNYYKFPFTASWPNVVVIGGGSESGTVKFKFCKNDADSHDGWPDQNILDAKCDNGGLLQAKLFIPDRYCRPINGVIVLPDDPNCYPCKTAKK